MSGGAHDGGILQSLLFTSRSQNQVLCEWLAPSELPAIRRVKGSPVMHFIRLKL